MRRDRRRRAPATCAPCSRGCRSTAPRRVRRCCFQLDDVDAALAVVAAVQQPPPGLEAGVDRREAGDRARRRPRPRCACRSIASATGSASTASSRSIGGTLELAVLLDAARRQQRYVRVDDTRWVELSDALRAAARRDRGSDVRGQASASSCRRARCPRCARSPRRAFDVEAAPAWQALTERLAAVAQAAAQAARRAEGDAAPVPGRGPRVARPGSRRGARGRASPTTWASARPCRRSRVLLDRAKLGPRARARADLGDAQLGRRAAPVRAVAAPRWSTARRPIAPRASPGSAPKRRADRRATACSCATSSTLATARRSRRSSLDEAQALKNPPTQRAKAARALDAGVPHRAVGHAAREPPRRAVEPVLGRVPGPARQLGAVPRRGSPCRSSAIAIPEARAALSRLIRPFLLRRTKAEVATRAAAAHRDPRAGRAVRRRVPSSTRTRGSRRSPSSRTRRKELRDEQQPVRGARGAHPAAPARLAPALYDAQSPVASSKMQRLLELLEELRSEGHRALVFSQFTSHLALVRARARARGLPRTLYLDGATPGAERARADRARSRAARATCS